MHCTLLPPYYRQYSTNCVAPLQSAGSSVCWGLKAAGRCVSIWWQCQYLILMRPLVDWWLICCLLPRSPRGHLSIVCSRLSLTRADSDNLGVNKEALIAISTWTLSWCGEAIDHDDTLRDGRHLPSPLSHSRSLHCYLFYLRFLSQFSLLAWPSIFRCPSDFSQFLPTLAPNI